MYTATPVATDVGLNLVPERVSCVPEVGLETGEKVKEGTESER